MLENLNLKQKIVFFIILSIMIIFIIYYIYSNLMKTDTNFISSLNNDLYNNGINENNSLELQSSSNIIVYVCGCVKENKNVILKEGSRISDAIDAAGGLTENADLTSINLAYILEDGEKIYIPQKGEIITNSNNSTSSSSLSFSASISSKNSKTNINKATQAELELISGIGPSTALKIINYRKENGNFKKIEDIKNVPGIGDAKFNQIKDYITVK